jgi:uncharacterized membrane protein YbhN (UPF0104 family)
MPAPDQAVLEFAPAALDVRALARRIGPPALFAGALVATLLLAGGRVHALTDALRRGLGAGAGWGLLGAAFECASLVGYIGLLSLVAGRASPRVGARQSAQITLAGTAATRVLPTAGAGGVALTLWTLRRAGLRPLPAARTMLVFLVLLYSVFLVSIAGSGAVLSLGLVRSRGPAELSAIASAAAVLAMVLCVAVACRHRAEGQPHAADNGEPAADNGEPARGGRRGRMAAGARLFGEAARDASRLARGGDPRLAGAIAYWAFDAAVLWAMLHAFGSAPVLPVVVLAYFVGQVANTVPLPGSVSGGIAAVLIAFGVAPEFALASVLAYRAVSVWLPTPVAIAAVPALRATVARWSREDGAEPLQTGSETTVSSRDDAQADTPPTRSEICLKPAASSRLAAIAAR